MGTFSFNPAQTQGPIFPTFAANTSGYVQGTFLDHPTKRMQNRQGYLTGSKTIVGGVPITALVSSAGYSSPLDTSGPAGNTLGMPAEWATAVTGITGFCVFNQANAMIIAPGEGVPTASPGMSMNFFNLGDKARIVVGVDSGFAAAVAGGSILQSVYWDFTNMALTTTASGNTLLACEIVDVVPNSLGWTYNATSGLFSWNPTPVTVAVIEI